jgi:hypothetical protein
MTGSPPAPAGFSPYVLVRRGTLSFNMLGDLVPVRTWALLDAAMDADVRVAKLTGRLENALHALVPGVPPADRRALLRLRRDVHNGRPVAAKLIASLPNPAAGMLLAWSRARDAAAALRAEAAVAYAAELDAGRIALGAIAADEDFQRGIQLSGEDVYREVTVYAADPFDPQRKPSRRRRVESTIVSYASRVVFKPSPFGSFTEVGAGPWHTPAGPRPPPAFHRRRRDDATYTAQQHVAGRQRPGGVPDPGD